MTHAEAELLVGAYADAELDPGRAREFESHLAGCALCAGGLSDLRADHAVLSRALAREPAPFALRARIRDDIRKAARREDGRRFASSPWMRYAATIAVTALLTGAGTLALTRRAGMESVADTVFNDHVRALATHQMIDTAGPGQRDGSLDYAPPVRDLKAQGFPLLGRRVDYVGGKPVAVFVYGRGGRLVSLFLRPVRRDQWPARVVTRRGDFNIVWWSNGTFECWAVSELSASELLQIRKLFLRGGEGVRL